MPTDLEIEIQGLKEVQKKMEQIVEDLQGPRFLEAMKVATLLVYRAAVKNAPWDTTRLRHSITPKIEGRGGNVRGIVGTNVIYAARMEQPGNVIKGGRRPYMEPALTENEDKITQIIGREVKMIVEK